MNFEFNFSSSASVSDTSDSPNMLDQHEQNAYHGNNSNGPFEYLISSSSAVGGLNVDAFADENSNKSGRYILASNMQNLYMQNSLNLSKWQNPKSQSTNSFQYMTDTTNSKVETQTSPSTPNTDFSTLSKSNIFSNTSFNKFQFILIAPTSPAVKLNEETLTYLNQGQNYELKLTKLNTPIGQSAYMEGIRPNPVEKKLSGDNLKKIFTDNTEDTLNQIVCKESSQIDKIVFQELTDRPRTNQSVAPISQNPDQVYLSVIRLCFWDRKLQEIEHEEIKEWENEYNNVRMLEIDNGCSFGVIDIRLSDMFTNAVEVLWHGNTGANLFFRCNCTSTAFAPHKHGGEKGIHMRFQIDTFDISQMTNSDLSSPLSYSQRTNTNKDTDLDFKNPSASPTYTNSNPNQYYIYQSSSYCRVQLFRLKGAQRKLKTDKLKVDRINPPDLKKRYQPSTKVTLLYNTNFDSLYSLMPFSRYMMDLNMNQQNTFNMLNLPHESNLDECIYNKNSTSVYLNNNNLSTSTCSISSQSSLSNSATSYSLTDQRYSGSQSFQLNSIEATGLHQTEQQSSGGYFLEKDYCINSDIKTDPGDMINVSLNCLDGNDSDEFCVDDMMNSISSENISLKRSLSISSSMNNFYSSNQQQSTNNYSYRHTKVQKTFSSPNNPLVSTTKNENWPSSSLTQTSPLQLNTSTNTNTSTNIQVTQKHQANRTLASSISLPSSPLHLDSKLSTDKSNTTNNCLPNDISNKLVQEWLVDNRFGHLVPIFIHYTSNDILRLTKEDMINLCGASDGIRCFNVAHNIQVRPKLTIFVKFKERSVGFYSAVFIMDRKADVLVHRLIEAYKYVETDLEINDYECEFKVYVMLKDILVIATDEYVSNLDDQSKYFVEVDKNSGNLVKVIMHPIY